MIALTVPIDDTEALIERAQGATVVIYAINPVYTQWDALMLPLARLGMQIAQRLGATFMLPGNVYNFGPELPSVLTEQTEQPTAVNRNTEKGHLRRELESVMRDFVSSGLNSVVIRAGDFYGAGSGSWLDLVITKELAKGKITYPGPQDLAHAWAYLPDLAQAFVAIASRRKTAGEAGSFGASWLA